MLSGRIVVGHLLKQAVKRYRRDLKDPRWRFDQEKAERPIQFIEELVHSTGEFQGQKFILRPWQRWVIWNIFGFVHAKDGDGIVAGTRRFREAFLQIGRGNGKTPLAAAIELYMCCADDPPEPRAEVVNAATEKGQSKLGTNEVCRFINHLPDDLNKLFTITKQAIVYLPTESSIVPLAKNAESKDGFNLHCYVCDELHAFKEEHQELLDKIETAMGKRRQPLGIYITTAGSDRSLIWIEKYNHAAGMLNELYNDDRMFAAIYEIDEKDNPLVEANWCKANPNLGISVKLDYLRGLAEKATRNQNAKNKLMRYHCNRLVSSSSKAIQLDLWNKCLSKLPNLHGLRLYGGLDLGWRNDLASFSVVFLLPNGEYGVKVWNWIPEESEKRDINRDPWFTWIQRGELFVTPGDVTDPEAIFTHIKKIKSQYNLQTIALDPNNAREMAIKLINELGMEDRVYDFFQNCRKYNEPTKKLLDLIEQKKLNHGGNQLLRWSAHNLILKSDPAGLVMPNKAKSTDKIDPMVATIMALSECLYGEASGKHLNQNKDDWRVLS